MLYWIGDLFTTSSADTKLQAIMFAWFGVIVFVGWVAERWRRWRRNAKKRPPQ